MAQARRGLRCFCASPFFTNTKGIDAKQSDIADFPDFLFKEIKVVLQDESAPAPVSIANGRYQMDTISIGAGSVQTRNDRIGRAILCGREDHISEGCLTFAAEPL